MSLLDRLLPDPRPAGEILGQSREGRSIEGLRFGGGSKRISLIAGCHADEPVGPRLLDRVCALLPSLPETHDLLQDTEWWIVPHANPDGAARNRSWQHPDATAYDPIEYLTTVIRELPGDDVEFGFPRTEEDDAARPENQAIARWWRTAPGPFSLHVSLHGMAHAGGPWFLVDAAWRDRCEEFKTRCRQETERLGYALHDVERQGEKGFHRLERGFCTRPSAESMEQYFQEKGDPRTARLFRPSSMDTIRRLGGDPLTLVTEMPLCLTPGVGENLGPPDPVAEEWRERISDWRGHLAAGKDLGRLRQAVASSGLRPLPVADQMQLQWTCITAGLEQVRSELG